MSIEDLPTLDQVNAQPHATRKDQIPTKLDRAIANKAARLLDARKLRAWAFAVKDRDHWKDRKTGRRVRRCLELDADRAEAHHIEPKSNPVTRTDVRNGITLSYENHARVERGDYRIDGTVWFRGSDGCRYVDGTYAVIFVRV